MFRTGKSQSFREAPQVQPVTADNEGSFAGDEIAEAGAQPASRALQLTTNDGERMLRIFSRTWQITRHYELFRLLQGDVQFFIPHQVLISAWGDFRDSALELDVISALPGVRTGRLQGCNIGDRLKDLHARWLAGDRRLLLLHNTASENLFRSNCKCALHESLRNMRSILVHGVHDARAGSDSLYLAANAGPIAATGGIGKFHDRIDPIISQIDVAFRRVGGLKSRPDAEFREGNSASGDGLLSGREEEILLWVSLGRTNVEISRILAISSFTVKNHVQRIIKKLRAGNRTEAAALYRQLPVASRASMRLKQNDPASP